MSNKGKQLTALPEPAEDPYIDFDGVDIFRKVAGRLLQEERLYEGHVQWLTRWVKTLRALHLEVVVNRGIGHIKAQGLQTHFNDTRRYLVDSILRHCGISLADLEEMEIDIPVKK